MRKLSPAAKNTPHWKALQTKVAAVKGRMGSRPASSPAKPKPMMSAGGSGSARPLNNVMKGKGTAKPKPRPLPGAGKGLPNLAPGPKKPLKKGWPRSF